MQTCNRGLMLFVWCDIGCLIRKGSKIGAGNMEYSGEMYAVRRDGVCFLVTRQ